MKDSEKIELKFEQLTQSVYVTVKKDVTVRFNMIYTLGLTYYFQ